MEGRFGMVKIKSLGKPPEGAHWSYGPDHMTLISPKDARSLVGDLPTMGRFKNVTFGLTVQNCSGGYYLASHTATINLWPTRFGIEVIYAKV